MEYLMDKITQLINMDNIETILKLIWYIAIWIPIIIFANIGIKKHFRIVKLKKREIPLKEIDGEIIDIKPNRPDWESFHNTSISFTVKWNDNKTYEQIEDHYFNSQEDFDKYIYQNIDKTKKSRILIDLTNPKIYYIEIPKKQNQSTVLNQENWNIKDILKEVKNTFSWEENSSEESKTSIKLVWLLPTILVFIFWIWLIIIRYKLWQDLTKAWKEVIGWIWFSFVLWSFFIIKWIFKR